MKELAEDNTAGFALDKRTRELHAELSHRNNCATDRVFAVLMLIQWVGGIAASAVVSPYTWIGASSQVHVHVWAAILLGGAIASLPVGMAVFMPGSVVTRHVIAVAQGCFSALLIHMMGGRLETHFHVFGSLAFLSLYRDWRVLITMTVVVSMDHFARGTWWPLSVYGVAVESPWRWLEHAAWVVFEDIVLISACLRGERESLMVCRRQAELEEVNGHIEEKVMTRTSELSDARSFFQAVLDSIESHICILDGEGRIVDTNAKWDEFALQNEGQDFAVGQNYLDVCRQATGHCADGAHRVANAIEKIIHGDLDYFTAEYPCHSPDQERWFQVGVTPLRSHAKGSAVVVHTSITDRVHAERELTRQKDEADKLALVAKYTDNAVVITDAQARIEWVNDGFTRITGYTEDEVRGRVPGAFLQGEQTDPVTVSHMRQALIEKRGFDVEIINYDKDGQSYWLAVEVRPIYDELGEVSKFIAIESDITARKRAEEEKQAMAQEMLDMSRQAGMAEVATGVLHNVGNVLNSVNVSATLLIDKLQTSHIGSIAKAAEMLNQHTDDIAGFLTVDERGKHFPRFLDQVAAHLLQEQSSQMEEMRSVIGHIEHIKEIVGMQQSFACSGGMTQPINIAQLMEDAVKINDTGLERHHVDVIREYEDLGEVLTDKHKVLQVLVNLISNAKHAMREAEHDMRVLTLVLTGEDSSVSIEVRDTGIGIPPENLTKVFNHGFTTKSDGHGFGLHCSALVAQELGGSLSAHSDGPGLGASFTLRIPVSRESTCLT